MSKKKSISFTVNKDMENYLNQLSEKLGMNRSSVITMILNQYRQGVETVTALGKAMDMVEKQEKK
jgi:antitoxin component of RelBE/YafQ-DinJ toxin-antitoxin module